MKITIEIDKRFAYELYGMLGRDMKSAQDILDDEGFTKKYPVLTEKARIVMNGADSLRKQLMEEMF